MNKVNKQFEIELNIAKYKGHANSPYSDGWTQEMYKELYEKELKKLKRYEQNRSKQVTN
jgi:hypothetical protein